MPGRGKRIIRVAVLGAILATIAAVVLPGRGGGLVTRTAAAGVGHDRRYFIAADEVVWDYAPLGHNAITGRPFDAKAATYVRRGPTTIGSRYRKALYRQYTDQTFRRLVPHDPDLGSLGPLIRAEVGDRVTVVFRNNATHPFSFHVHGLQYDKSSEGSPYADGTSGADKDDDAVPPGGQHVYRYTVPDRVGPADHDGSSVLWMYHSHTDEVKDTYAGLVGPIVVTRRGMARPDGSPRDVDRELFDFFEVSDENQSWYLDRNIHDFTGTPSKVNRTSDDFLESNLMHSINGFVYGDGPLQTVKVGQRVRWYAFSLGTEVDLHTPHWHGNTVTSAGMRTDAVSLLPGTMAVADMVPDDPGTWLFHCHVNDHILAGMITRYRVET